MNASQHRLVALVIPSELPFEALELRRDPVTHEVSFRWEPIERICAVSGVDVAVFRGAPEDNLAGLLVAWYHRHLEAGGATNAVVEQILAEVEAEDRYGALRVQSGAAGEPQ